MVLLRRLLQSVRLALRLALLVGCWSCDAGFCWVEGVGGLPWRRYVDVLGLMGTMMSMVRRPEIGMWRILPEIGVYWRVMGSGWGGIVVWVAGLALEL